VTKEVPECVNAEVKKRNSGIRVQGKISLLFLKPGACAKRTVRKDYAVKFRKEG